MTILFVDGFDHYGVTGMDQASAPALNTMIAQYWTISGTGVKTLAPLSATGQSLQIAGGSTIQRTMNAAVGRIMGGIRFQSDLLGDHRITFFDGGVAQTSVVLQATTGFILVSKGDDGAVLQTSSASITAGVTHTLVWDITFNTGTSGIWSVWLDGVLILSGTGATQQSGNATCNIFRLTGGGATSAHAVFDDFFINDANGSHNNTPNLAAPRVQTDFPIADHQKQFANVGSILGVDYSADGGGALFTLSGNKMFLERFTSAVSQIANSINILCGTTSAANIRPLLYTDASGVAATLVTSGGTVAGGTSGSLITLPLSTFPTLSSGGTYWIGYMTDGSVPIRKQDQIQTAGWTANATFTSGAPAVAPALTSGSPSCLLFVACSGAASNWQSVAVNPPPGTGVTSIQDATVGDEDLYVFPALATDIVTIHSVTICAHAQLPNTGTRFIGLHMLSAATDSNGSLGSVQMGNSFAWYASHFETDPNGGGAWTNTTLANSFAGVKVEA